MFDALSDQHANATFLKVDVDENEVGRTFDCGSFSLSLNLKLGAVHEVRYPGDAVAVNMFLFRKVLVIA